MKNARILGILRCEEDLLCKSIEVLGETAYAMSLRTSLRTNNHAFLSTCEFGRKHKLAIEKSLIFQSIRLPVPAAALVEAPAAVPVAAVPLPPPVLLPHRPVPDKRLLPLLPDRCYWWQLPP